MKFSSMRDVNPSTILPKEYVDEKIKYLLDIL